VGVSQGAPLQKVSHVSLSPTMSTGGDEVHPTGLDSDADSDDIGAHLARQFEVLAMKSFGNQDYAKAETYLRKLINRGADDGILSTALTKMKTWPAFACACQGKREEAESILVPVAMAKELLDIIPFYGLNAVAIFHLAANDYDTAIKYCKWAVWSIRKFGGKASTPSYESIALLADIYEVKGDSAKSAAYRSLIPFQIRYHPSDELPANYIKRIWPQYLPFSVTMMPVQDPYTVAESLSSTIHTNSSFAIFERSFSKGEGS
jgi:tetratricopeptide (TPR) repeat protein